MTIKIKQQCPTCGKTFINLEEHVTKIHTKIYFKINGGSLMYKGKELTRSGSNHSSSDGTERPVFEGWKKPKSGGFYHEFEIAYNTITKKIITFTECLTNGKRKKLITSNIIIVYD